MECRLMTSHNNRASEDRCVFELCWVSSVCVCGQMSPCDIVRSRGQHVVNDCCHAQQFLTLKQACGLARDTGKHRILTHFTPRPRHPRTHVALVKSARSSCLWGKFFFFCERAPSQFIFGSVSRYHIGRCSQVRWSRSSRSNRSAPSDSRAISLKMLFGHCRE